MTRIHEGIVVHGSRLTVTRRLCAIALFGTVLSPLCACGREDVTAEDHLDAIPDLVVEANLRLGDVENPDSGFSQVFSADVDRDGNIYVMEASVPEIRVFDPDGTLIRRIGRRGEGPGEFQRAPRFGVAGDTVWAVSFGPSRITVFNRRGDLLSDRRSDDVAVPLPTAVGHVEPWLMRSDGRFLGQLVGMTFDRSGPPEGGASADSIPVPYVLFDPTGVVVDTIGWAPRPPPGMGGPPSREGPEPAFVEVGGRRLQVPSVPTSRNWWLPGTDGYVLVETPLAEAADDGAFAVSRIGVTNDTVFHRSLHYRPVRYSAADLDSVAVHAARGEAGGGVPYSPDVSPPPDWEAAAARLREAMSFPEFKPPISRAWLAQDESVWLRLSGEVPVVALWVLLDAAGHPVAKLALPSKATPIWANGDRFMTVEPDELDIPWVVRYRILPDPR